jgi:predicted transcriptional regulator of viral defense system
MNKSIASIIKERILQIEESELFTVSDFADLNNDEVVTRTLSRLQKDKKIVRVATGIYTHPTMIRFG